MTSQRLPLPGSAIAERAATASAHPLDPAAEIELSLVLRRRAEPSPADFAGPPLTRDELAERFGADPHDLASVTAALVAAGHSVVSADAASRLVRVRGALGALADLFGTSLESVEWTDGTASAHATGAAGRRRAGELTVPQSLADPLIAVLGLDDRPSARTRYAIAQPRAGSASYTPLQLAGAYGFPDGDGTGQTIAIIELGGGFGQADLDSYFGGLKLTPPTVTAVGVDGATNVAGKDPQGADGEVLLDIEVAGAIAPAAKQLVYFAPNTDAGFLDAITQAAHASPAPTVMSISWGQSEDQWTAQSRSAMDKAFADAALLGVTVLAAAGDNGSADAAGGGSSGIVAEAAGAAATTAGAVHADFPASSPHVLGCGGTSLTLDASGAIASETVWNDGGQGGATGGGVSDAFPLPDWQQAAGVPDRAGASTGGRGVPDVAAVADPQTGYQVVVDGQSTVIGGTSAVAPLWAGLICRLAQRAGKPLGLIQPTLYQGAAQGSVPAGFHDITSGSNGAYTAAAGWDACTGLGSPDGAALAGRFPAGGS